MAFLRKIKAGLVKFPVEDYVGEVGHLFYNEETGKLYISDGVTVGGIPIAGGGALTTDDLPEGPSNLYYTQARVYADIDQKVTAAFVSGLLTDADTLDGFDSLYFATAASVNALSNSLSNLDTDDVSEGATNLYFTNGRVTSLIDTRVDKAFVDNLDVDADTLDGFSSLYFATAADLTTLSNDFSNIDTDSVPEGTTNFYYTLSRFDSAFANKDTDDLDEGTTNLYYTNARANSAISTRVNKNFVDALNVDADTLDGNDSTYFATQTTVDNLTTSDIAEGTNLYFTNPRAVTAVGGSVDDAGTAADDIWSAVKIASYVDSEVGVAGNVGIQTTIGLTDADTIIRTDSAGRLSASFLIGRSTTDLSEGTNLYFTDPRAVTAVGGSVNDTGTAADDIWSAVKIASYVDGEVGTAGTVGIQTSNGSADADKLIRTDAAGFLDASFLLGSDTDDLAEGTTNLYYTTARFNTDFTGRTTTSLAEGTNLYFTDPRAVTAVGGSVNDTGTAADDIWSAVKITSNLSSVVGTSGTVGIQASIGASDAAKLIRTNAAGYLNATFLTGLDTDDLDEGTVSLYYTQGRFDTSFANKDTNDLDEGTGNLYFTNSRATTAVGGAKNDAGTSTSDLWSASKIISNLDTAVGTGGNVGIDASVGSASGDKLIRTSAAGFLDNSFIVASTNDITEGTNLYYTQTRFDTAFGNKTTTGLTEGTNLYYTATRVNGAIDTRVTKSFVDNLNVDADTLDGLDSTYFASQTTVNNLTTDDVAEGANLYFTDLRAVDAVGGSIADTGTNADDLWSASKIISNLNTATGPGGTIGITATSGVGDANKIIRTTSSGYLDSSLLIGRNTSDLSEGTNLYYTQGRFDTAFTNKDTDALSEGTTNLYYTDGRANSAVDVRVNKAFVDNLGVDADTLDGNDSTYFATEADLTTLEDSVTNLTTDEVAEGTTNLYFTDARVQALLAIQSFRNIIHVDKSPLGANEFATVAEAIAEINLRGNASAVNPYVVEVAAGLFSEPPFTIPANVAIQGFGSGTILSAIDETQSFITMPTGSAMRTLTIDGPQDTGAFSIELDDSAPGELSLDQIVFGSAWGLVSLVNTTSQQISVILNAVEVKTGSQITKPFVVSSESTGRIDAVFNGFSHALLNPLLNIAHYIDVLGPATLVLLNSVRISTFNGASVGHALHVENGANVILTTVGLTGVNVGIHVANVGAAPFVRSTGLVSEGITWDVLVEHPGTTGTVSGILQRDKVSIASPDVVLNIISPLAPGNGQVIIGDIFQGDATNRTTNITSLIRDSATMGIRSGGQVTYVSASNEITISAGVGYLVDITDSYVIDVAWTETTLTVNDGEERWITVGASGVVSAESSPPANFINSILLARVYADEGEIKFVEDIANRLGHVGNRVSEYTRDAIGPIYVSGSIVTASTTPLQINASAGAYYYGPTKFEPTGGADLIFRQAHRDGLSDYITDYNVQSVPVKYDDDSGTLSEPTTGYYVKHSLYVVGGTISDSYYLVVGQDQFDNISVAEQANLPLPPAYIKEAFALIASIIVQEGESGIISVRDERPVLGFKASGVSAATTHGNLLGLDQDDHTQYLRVDGTRAVSGTLNLGTNSLINVTTVNGVTVEAHAARHLPNGADPLTTGTPSTIGTANSTGIQNAFARQDHVHSHGNQLGGGLHAVATPSTAGFMSAADKTLLNTIGTDDVAEETNLYFTDPRAVTAVGGSVDDAGTAADDIWSAVKIASYVDSAVGTAGTVGIQTTTGVADTDILIRTDASGYLDASFLIGRDTDDLSEGTNLYYTQTRFDTAFGNKTTTGLTEGTNLYFTNGRATTAVGGSVDDAGTAADDIWSAVKIASYVDSEVGVAGNVGIQSTAGVADTDILIRTDASGYLDASFLVGSDTDDLSEGLGNLYYTQARFNTAFSNKDTDALSEGGANLYFTNTRANSAIDTRVNKAFVDALNVDADTLDGFDSTYFTPQTTVDNLTTSDIAEGTNLYFTSLRATTAVGGAKNDAGTGTSDLWSADRITDFVDGEVGTGGNVGIQTTAGVADADKIIRANTAGYLDASFLLGRDTDDLSEGATNLYYTNTRANSAIDVRVNKAFVDALNVDADTLDGNDSTFFATQTTVDNLDTDDIAEGVANLYFTNGRATTAVGGAKNDAGAGTSDLWSASKITSFVAASSSASGIQATAGATDSDKIIRTDAAGYLDASFLLGSDTDDLSEGTNLYYTQGRFDTALSNKDTDDVAEGTNLYFTDPRAVTAVGGSVNDIGTAADDIWSAVKIASFVDGEVGTSGAVGIQTTAGAADADKLIRTDVSGALAASFLVGRDTDDIAEGTTNLYYTQARFNTALSNKDTDNVAEGVANLYFTNGRATTAVGGAVNDAGTGTSDIWSADQIALYVGTNTDGLQATAGVADADTLIRTDSTGYLNASFLIGSSTSDLSEGTNLYYTSTRFDNAFDNKDTDALGEGVANLYYTQTRFNSSFGNKSTADLTEGTNLYYTDTRATTAVGGAKNDAGTGTSDLWSASKITSFVDTEITGTQATAGVADADKLISTDSAGYLDASFLIGRSTTDLSEGTNLYYTSTRFDNEFGNKNTDALGEGVTNLYYTQTRFNTAFNNKDSDALSEGVSNLYFTDTRATTAVGGAKNDAGTGTSDLWSASKIRSEITSSTTGDHGNLTGLADNDHPQYLLRDGTNAMTGALNLSTNNITNVGTINSVTVEAHAARHLPNGADPIATATAVNTSNNTDSVGTANSLARSDHKHQLSSNTPSTNNIMQWDGSDWTAVNTYNVYKEAEGQQTTTSGTFVQALTLAATIPETGDYEVTWSMEARNTDKDRDTLVRVQMDNSTTLMEVSHGRENDRIVAFRQLGGFRRYNITAGVHNFDVDFRAAEDTAQIRRIRIQIKKVI